MALTKTDLQQVRGVMDEAIAEHPKFDAIDNRIGRVEAKIGGVEARLDKKIDGVETKLGSRIDGVEATIVKKIDSAKDEVIDEITKEIQLGLSLVGEKFVEIGKKFAE